MKIFSGYVREQKRYTKNELKHIFSFDEAGVEKFIKSLKAYGVLKSVKNSNAQLEMSDLVDEDIEITDETAVSGDCLYVFTYVGVITSGSRVIKVYPKYLLSPKEAPVKEMKQVIKVLERYSNSEEQIINIFNGDGDNRSFNILAVILFLLKDYHEYGIYTNNEDIVEVNGEGEILWGKTIDESFAIIEDNRPYYMEMYTGKTVEDDMDYFKRLHECVITECSRQLHDAQLDTLFDIDTVELSEESLSNFGDKDYILERLHKELNIQFNTRRQILLKTIYTYISQDKRMLEENDGISMFGTTAYHAVWEKVCAENFGSVLDTAIVDLPLYKEKTNKTETKETTLRDVIKTPIWRKSEYPMVKDPKVETLKPDLVCIYPVDDEQKDYCFGIYDAKYYCIDYQVKDNKAKISGQPGVGDVTKQYLYQLAFDDFIVKQGYRYVQNMFFCPGETADRDFGWVQMDMLHQIGDKKLENIAVVKLCASEMYDIYLENKTIDEREIGKYIPVVGIQEVENKNFAKRMLAYLTRITNASKMAEKKLEMKAERGNLIYPKQIKRELGAKIIYDAICPVASKAFYGFDPYEKETYGGMVAEDIGDSYVRCGQIADAAIEIEKIIKDLSEQELQDEKVVKVILKKCFENKEDIASMAEGMCLEMLTEKVMELVRDLYL